MASTTPWRLWRIVASRPRLVIGVLCAVGALVFLPETLTHPTRVILSWDIGAVVFLGLSASLFSMQRRDRIAEDAAAQEEGEWTVFCLTLAAVAFSFATVIQEFAHIKIAPTDAQPYHVALVAITLLLSWLMTHSTFAFRYAHEYYQVDSNASGINGGLQFPGEDQPDYLDFLYFSIVIGMTFQVSDVGISSRSLRRLATAHGFLSFLFNTIILALSVNLAAGLL